MKPFLFTLHPPRFAGERERKGKRERGKEGKRERGKGKRERMCVCVCVCVCVWSEAILVLYSSSFFSSFLGHAGRAGYIPCMRF